MSSEVRALRNADGSMNEVAFSDSLIPLTEVHKRIEQPLPCKVQTRASAGLPKNQRRFEAGDFYLHPNGSLIEQSAEISIRSMFGPLVVIHAGVKVDAAKIHPGVELEPGVEIASMVEVHDGVLIGESTKLGLNCIVDKGSRIGGFGEIFSSKLGPNCKIGERASLWQTQIDGSLTAGDNITLSKANIFSNVKLGEGFKAGQNLVIKQGASFGRHALLGNDVRIADSVNAQEFCAIEDTVTIESKSRIKRFVEIGARSLIDVGVELSDNTILEEWVYLGPYVEVSGHIARNSHIAYRQKPIPVWPIPERAFRDGLEK